MNINLHNTKRVELGPVLPVNDRFYRIINIITDKDQPIEVTLFANTEEELEVTI